MRWYRFIPVGLGLCGLVVLGGALAAPGAATRPTQAAVAPFTPPPSTPDPAAQQTLKQVIAALEADRVEWLETGIWQKVQLPGFGYEASGSYRMAPGHRFRLELDTHTGGAEGKLLLVSDGSHLWEATRVGPGEWTSVTRLGLHEVFDTLNGAAGSPQLKSEFLQGPTFSGVGPLLRNLRSHLTWVRRQVLGLKGAEQIELTGVWTPELLAALAPADQPWPAALPHLCRLRLNPRTLWPERIEWWGPPAPGGRSERLLAQMEFRSPRLNRPLSDEECKQAFRFDPGAAHVDDETGLVTADLAARARQLGAHAAGR